MASGSCFVAEQVGGPITAYGVMRDTFFHQSFIETIYVCPDFRRCGLGAALLRHMEKGCATPKLFTSTNRSNTAMRALLARENFRESGLIDNLDEGDPEVVYFKKLP